MLWSNVDATSECQAAVAQAAEETDAAARVMITDKLGSYGAAKRAGFEAQAAIMEGAPGWLCAGGGIRRVRAPLVVGSAVRSCSCLVAAKGPSKGLGAAAGGRNWWWWGG